jgi:hypothetical protein
MSTTLDSSSRWDWALFSVRTYSDLRDSISSFAEVGFFSRQNTYTSCSAREYRNIEVRNWNILAHHSPIRKSSHWLTTSLTAASNVPDYATKLSPKKTVTLVISLPAGRCVMRTVAEAEALGMKGGRRNKLSLTPNPSSSCTGCMYLTFPWLYYRNCWTALVAENEDYIKALHNMHKQLPMTASRMKRKWSKNVYCVVNSWARRDTPNRNTNRCGIQLVRWKIKDSDCDKHTVSLHAPVKAHTPSHCCFFTQIIPLRPGEFL